MRKQGDAERKRFRPLFPNKSHYYQKRKKFVGNKIIVVKVKCVRVLCPYVPDIFLFASLGDHLQVHW